MTPSASMGAGRGRTERGRSGRGRRTGRVLCGETAPSLISARGPPQSFNLLLLLLVLFLLGLSHCVGVCSAHGLESSPGTTPPAGPHFLPPPPHGRNVTTSVGHTAYLHCLVAYLPDQAKVSWIRKRDLHVMSSGIVVFASDQRFQVLHADSSERWTLQIKYAQPRDAGVYECQVNTEPKISMAFTLNVIEAVANLTGPEYVMAGSNINLTCTLAVPHPQGLVHWYQGAEILDYEGRVSITTGEDGEGLLRSELVILRATPAHSGNYTC